MKTSNNAPSWGRLINRHRTMEAYDSSTMCGLTNSCLPYGNGRSYGDSCHNDEGVLLHSRRRNAILDFDKAEGVLRAETGILFSEILLHLNGSGWFLPVVPGTKFVTLGGAIANDIHGKNHGHRGTFGRHINGLMLATSDNQVRHCTPEKNSELFAATIAGMGLTGYIVEAEVQLIRVPSHQIEEQKTTFHSLNEFIEMSEHVESSSEYSVAWIDSLATGKKLGRGILISGEHARRGNPISYGDPKFKIPFTPPIPLVTGPALRAFNFTYFQRNSKQDAPRVVSPDSFFFPLDAIGDWNRLYGPKGLFQHQCALPFDTAPAALHALLRTSQLAGHGSFLTVLKRFGDHPSPGLLSFPKPGFTLTLDFPNKGNKTRALLDELDTITIQAGGRVNPYKDGRMSADTFQRGFPNWQQLEMLRDPAMMSDFWLRVTSNKSIDAPSIETPIGKPTAKSPINQVLKPQIQDRSLRT